MPLPVSRATRRSRSAAPRPTSRPATLTFKIFDSINGAENALGMDLDGINGAGAAGPVTVVFGNVDGGAPDFAIALFGVTSVNAADFLL